MDLRINQLRLWVLSLILLSFVSTLFSAHADEKMILDESGGRGTHTEIRELVFDQTELEITGASGALQEVTLSGAYTRQDWTLLIRAEPIRRDKEGRFALKVKISSGNQALLFRAVGPKGEVESRWVVLRRSSVEPVAREKDSGAGFSLWDLPWRARVLGGLGSVKLVQTLVSPSLNSKVLDIELRGGVFWDGGASHEISASYGRSLFDFGSTPADKSLQDRHGSIQGAYRFWRNGPWGARVVGGLRFQSMETRGGNFGFRNASMPMLYPELRREFGRYAIRGYFRYSPLFNGLSIKGGGDYDLGGRAAFEWARKSKRLNWVELDYSVTKVSSAVSLVSFSSLKGMFGWEF